MNNIKFSLILFMLMASCSATESETDRDVNASASYRITFIANWTQNQFSVNFPNGNDHFSGLIGATHNNQISFWSRGQQASQGIENIAETGSKLTFESEIQEQKQNSNAEFLLSGSGLSSGEGSVELEFDINETHPQVTLISMLAPSPDWFVGVHNLQLLNNSQWVSRLEIDLALYDAGTDSGNLFNSANFNSNGFVSLLTSFIGDTDFREGVHRDTGEYVGKFIFDRIK